MTYPDPQKRILLLLLLPKLLLLRQLVPRTLVIVFSFYSYYCFYFYSFRLRCRTLSRWPPLSRRGWPAPTGGSNSSRYNL